MKIFASIHSTMVLSVCIRILHALPDPSQTTKGYIAVVHRTRRDVPFVTQILQRHVAVVTFALSSFRVSRTIDSLHVGTEMRRGENGNSRGR
jgi:hypothetical protein